MKLCGGRSKMTQSRSSILLALVVLVIVVVETSTQSTDDVVHMDKDGNQTNYDLPIQMNFIDSEIKADENDIGEVHPSEPVVIDLDHEFPNKTIATDKVDATTISENEENTTKNEVFSDDISTPEVQQGEESVNETNKNVENVGQTVEAVPLETTTVPSLDESISTLIPINENILITENTLATVHIIQVETQTQSIDIPQETSTNYNSKKLQDLSIYFENEPSRARQLRGFNKESDNEVIAHHSDSASESNSNSNISTSSESAEISHSSDALPGQDENKAAEDSSISEDVPNEKTTAEPKIESLANIPIEAPTVEEIKVVTESTGEITNDVTVIANVENHTIMKKPGVDDESPKNITDDRLLEEQPNEVATMPNIESDPVVNLVLNRRKEVLAPSPTTITLTENIVSDIEDTSKSPTKQLEDVDVTEKSNSEKTQVPVLETKSFPESKLLEKSKEIEEDSNSVDLETPSYHQDNKMVYSEEISFPDLQKSIKPHPENASNQQYNEPISGTNVISYSETHDDKILEDNLLIDNIETSTKAPSVQSNEQSLFEVIQEDQPRKEINGIFKEEKEDPLNSTEKSVQSSTEKSIEDPIGAPVEKNHIETIIGHNISPEDSIQTSTEKTLSSISNEESFSDLNSIAYSETNLLTDHSIETSTQSPSLNRVESELPGEVQDDQTSKTDNGIFKEIDDTRLNPTDESLPDPKLYEETVETSTEKPTMYIIGDPTTASLEKNQFGTTTDYARHVDSLQTMRDESSSVVSDEVIAPASAGRSINEIIAQGLGKPLPTRSVGDVPSSSSYSSEDKTTTVLVLCAAAGGIFVAFSLAIYLISFQRQHGTLDIEMQEQRCGKDNLEDDDDSETRVSLLNQIPTVDSDEHSSD